MACTDDACDPVAGACVSTIRDGDDDGFGDASCGGDDCDDADPAVHPGAGEACANGRDDDCDLRTDCSDADCVGDPGCEGCAPEDCRNAADDDCDGLVDCDDSDCADDPMCCHARETGCANGRDDDCDGLVDCLDPDCEADPRCCVAADEVCNGLDDDCDGVADDGVGCYFLDGSPIEAVHTAVCGREFYGYGSPDDASANPVPDVRRADGVVVVVQEGPCGATVSVIADTTNDGDGGRLAASFTIDPRNAGGVLQSDEPSPGLECTYRSRSGDGSCDWVWQPCCTDGVMLGEFEESFCVVITLSSPSGVRDVVVQDGPAETIARGFDVPIEICGQLVPEA
ncbi:MAG: hypothetical protein KC619_34105 [Myxococcales bacterium]|nr:hypothetical protein [Myxococcales bacterium]